MDEEEPQLPLHDSTTSERSDEAAKGRDRTSNQRDRTSERSDRTLDSRDRTAEDRDRTSEVRDRSAEERDRVDDKLEAGEITAPRRAERRTRVHGRRRSDLLAAEGRGSAASDRVGAASDRAEAASDREAASVSRQRGAHDRTRASDDRAAASADRDASARDRKVSSIDELTGAYRRGIGLVELERELMRSMRTSQPFVLAFLDVDELKATNDTLGHAAGDDLLRAVVNSVRAHLRVYDLIVRFGGDEFICALPEMSLDEAAKRFEFINKDLSAGHGSATTVGLAELKEGDSLVTLIARADEALYEERARP